MNNNQKADPKKAFIRQKQLYNAYDDYYFVNMRPIKFLVYDFKSDKLVEISDEFRQSQVEFKKHENFSKPNTRLVRKQTKRKKKEKKNEEKKEKEDQINNEYILMKQLEYALSKQETQPEITRLRIVSSINFFIIIAMIIIFFSFMIVSQNNLKDNLNLISNSFSLIINSISGVYYSRELILLNNPSYTNFISERTGYIKNITDNLQNLFSNSSDLYNNILIKEISVNDELGSNVQANSTTDVFSLSYEDNINIRVMQDNMQYKQIESTLDSAFNEANTAQYHIAITDISEISPKNKDAYFYIFNTMNSILQKFYQRGFIYVEYVQNKIDDSINKFLYVLAASFVVSIGAFISIYYSFLAVILRKQSYLEVFFEIGEDVIKKSIENCESFSTKLQIDKQNEEGNISKASSNDEDEEEEEESENPGNNYDPYNPFSSMMNFNSSNNGKNLYSIKNANANGK